MSFSFDEALTNAYTRDGSLYGVRNLDGYDSRSVTVVRGSNPTVDRAGHGQIEVFLPVARIPIASVGDDRRISLPTIGFDSLTQWAQGDRVSNRCSAEDPEYKFVLARSCKYITPIRTTSIDLTVGHDIGTGYIEAASPDTLTDDELHWRAVASLHHPQAIVADPYSRHDESIRAFFAALILSLAAPVVSPLGGRLLHRISEFLNSARGAKKKPS
ncbi:hypothetical protein Q7F20_03325 [Curtobacterium sp. A7_M15]|uniref:hypothetical protein n=1 Tax=Curtobacterium sp. A7_M15 TaxID=3065241 RepID=UPI002737A069|nr:hypothetical protein [Curtobacterium sp. A7_M15]MDP4332388.1 hypothetical protein [Curtobacterium sp. A7_M15]